MILSTPRLDLRELTDADLPALRATLHDGDRLCAEAHGLFVLLKPGQQ